MARRKLVKPGTPVFHKVYGNGVIVGCSEDPDGILVRFDERSPKWGRDTIEVSSVLLNKRWGRAVGDKKAKEPDT